MTKKSYKNMDRTSAAMAKALDAKREEHKKKRAAAKKPKRGGYRY